MPRPLRYTLVFLFVLSLVPLALIAKARTSTSPKTRLHVVPDMDSQAKFKPQTASSLFADGRAMRLPVPGTVAREDSLAGTDYRLGKVGEEFISGFPAEVAVDRSLLERGRERFGIYCTPCHGLTGHGDGMVARRAEELEEGTWTPPSNLHDKTVRERGEGHLFNTISNGIRNMPGYAAQIPIADRWAIVAYVRALQRAEQASLDDVPAEERSALERSEN